MNGTLHLINTHLGRTLLVKLDDSDKAMLLPLSDSDFEQSKHADYAWLNDAINKRGLMARATFINDTKWRIEICDKRYIPNDLD